MNHQIQEQLKALEQRKSIKILLAAESGSRAWGFPSPDSDYDVRIIYVHQLDWYLSINDKKESVDYFHGELLDFSGWEIRKTLRLLKKSNATPFEWAQSPIIYQEEENFRADLLRLAEQFFQPYHTINHYKGIAINSYSKGDFNGAIKLKKLFYVLRPLFAIQWIEKKQTMPPMNIFSLMEVIQDEALKKKVLDLIKLKASVNEDFVYTIDPLLKDYIEKQFQRLDQVKSKSKKAMPDADGLNIFFRKLLKKHWE